MQRTALARPLSPRQTGGTAEATCSASSVTRSAKVSSATPAGSSTTTSAMLCALAASAALGGSHDHAHASASAAAAACVAAVAELAVSARRALVVLPLARRWACCAAWMVVNSSEGDRGARVVATARATRAATHSAASFACSAGRGLVPPSSAPCSPVSSESDVAARWASLDGDQMFTATDRRMVAVWCSQKGGK